MEEQTIEPIELPPVPEPKRKKREVGMPTHIEFDWFDRHVGLGYAQEDIAITDGVTYEEVVRSVRYVGRWMRKNFTEAKRYEIARSKNLYRLEKIIVGLMRHYETSSDIQAAREVRMCIHEWMEITGGLEPKRIETTTQSTIFQVNSSVEKMLNSNTPVPPKLLEAARTVREVEAEIVA